VGSLSCYLAENIGKSQNLRVVEVGSGLWRSSGPTPRAESRAT